MNCANLHSKLGNYEQAEFYYRKAIDTMPISLTEDNGSISFFNNFKNYLNSKKLKDTNNLNDEMHKNMFNKNVVHFKQTDSSNYLVSTMQLRAALNLANLLSNNPLKTFEANRLYEQLIVLKPDHGATYLSWI